MATIQIRDVPEAVHRILQARAAAAGMSLQMYLREELVRNARVRTPAEIVAEVDRSIEAEGPAGYARASAADLIRADRELH